LLQTGQGRGHAASQQVAQHLNRWVVDLRTHTRLGGQPAWPQGELR
jgi:hypothetical protein